MAHFKPLPSKADLLEHLKYDPETGLLWWVKRGTRRTLLKPVGCKCYQQINKEPKGMEVRLYGELWMAHRLAWRMMTGDDPGKLTIDHINRNPFDNKWKNLRLADFSLQLQNRRCSSESGHKGVWFDPRQRKWRATAWQNGKTKYLGRFATKEEAAAVAAPYYIT
jgi:hypothetical protein